MVNVAILGASNAIVGGGWHSRMKRSDVNVKCFAVGGSNSGIGIYKYIQESVIDWADVVIINFGVTEHEELKHGFISDAHLEFLVSNLYKTISSSGIPLISLYLPIADGVDNQKYDTSYLLHKACAEETGALFIDGYKFTRDIINGCHGRIPASFLFLDRHHLAPWVTRHIGMAVGEIINDIVSVKKNSEKKYSISNFRILTAGDISIANNLSIETRGTSLIKESTSILQKGEFIKFNENTCIHGIYIDCGISEVKLAIKSQSKIIVKNFFCAAQKTKKDSVQFKFCVFRDPVYVDSDSSISIAPFNSVVTEKNRMEREVENENGKAYICGVLLSDDECSVECLIPETSSLTEVIQLALNNRASDCIEIIKFKYLDSGFYSLSAVCESKLSSIGDYLYHLSEMMGNVGFDAAKEALSNFIQNNSLSLNYISDYDLISSSALFDKEFYLKTNPDVLNAGVDPISHFLNHGCSEGRNPSENFCVRKYVSANANTVKPGENALVHFLRSKK